MGGKDFEAAADQLWSRLIETAGGFRKTKNEVNDYREIMIFKNGVLL